MPLTEKGETILHAMEEKYGEEKGKEVFYASRNKGTIKGVDSTDSSESQPASESLPEVVTPAEMNRRNEKYWKPVENSELSE